MVLKTLKTILAIYLLIKTKASLDLDLIVYGKGRSMITTFPHFNQGGITQSKKSLDGPATAGLALVPCSSTDWLTIFSQTANVITGLNEVCFLQVLLSSTDPIDTKDNNDSWKRKHDCLFEETFQV